jgi:hypothetical protein
MSQFEMSITYICREDNTVADALSRLPPEVFDDEDPDNVSVVGGVLKVRINEDMIHKIQERYKEDIYCKNLIDKKNGMPGLSEANDFWYLGSCLLIPHVLGIREALFQVFRLAHDNMGHFGKDKSYNPLKNDYYWLNMRKDLEEAYILSCSECQRNKSLTQKP